MTEKNEQNPQESPENDQEDYDFWVRLMNFGEGYYDSTIFSDLFEKHEDQRLTNDDESLSL